MINLTKHEDMILNIVKGKFGLKNKSQAISLVIGKFEESFLEPELRPEFKKELERIDKGEFTRFNTIEDLRKEIENV
ncbi:MAG: DUF2683 family protein [archaeon]